MSMRMVSKCVVGLLAMCFLSASLPVFAVAPVDIWGTLPAEVEGRDRSAQAATGPIIIDHNSTDVTAIPSVWLEEASNKLHIAYWHTSHGSQLTTGMTGLVGFANNGGLGLELSEDIFAYNVGGIDSALDLREPFWIDAGYYPDWVTETRKYLGDSDPDTGRGTSNPETNVVVWAWCGQVSDYTAQQMLDSYLVPMTQLEMDYPGITFVYMTGHADGTGEEGNLHLRNQQIRDYCIANGKVLYDFYDIELYDPDKSYYGDKAVTDTCHYDSDGNGTRDRNWAFDWQGAHTEDTDWYSCDCAHSQALNCNQKAYAAWWLWARLAGWEVPATAVDSDFSASEKTVVPRYVTSGERVTYTIVIRDANTAMFEHVALHDELPSGISYASGTLTATAGTVDDTGAPLLSWQQDFMATSVTTVTYAATIDELGGMPQVLTSTAVIDTMTGPSVSRSAVVHVNWRRLFLPTLLR